MNEEIFMGVSIPTIKPASSLEEGAARVKETQRRMNDTYAALVSAKESLKKAMADYENAQQIDREAQQALLMLVRQDA